jgi:hypothetical protein
MSVYEVDKLMREVIQREEARAAFLTDPAAFLAERELRDEERDALLRRDYAALYRLRAHPFLLWAFTKQVYPDAGPALAQEYVAAITPLGNPDFAT